MTSTEPSPLPADPVRYRRKGLSVGFWLALVFGLVCIAAGMWFARYVPILWPKEKVVAASTPAPPWRVTHAEPVEAAVSTSAAGEAIPAVVPAGDVASLSARIAELETGQARTLQAAASALATSALMQAAQTSRPFTGELAAVEPLLPPSGDIAQLRRLAQSGAPTRSALAAGFPDAAARAIAASRRPGAKASLVDRARHALGSIVTIRRIDYTEGTGAHAILARAEGKVEEGDIEGALTELDALSPAAREALGSWRTRAERRAEVDRRLAAVREAALRSLRDSGAGA